MADKKVNTPAVKKWARGPFVWVVLALIIVSIGASLLAGGGFKRIDTNQGLQLLEDKKVEQVKVVDGDQRVDMVLKLSLIHI